MFFVSGLVVPHAEPRRHFRLREFVVENLHVRRRDYEKSVSVNLRIFARGFVGEHVVGKHHVLRRAYESRHSVVVFEEVALEEYVF